MKYLSQNNATISIIFLMLGQKKSEQQVPEKQEQIDLSLKDIRGMLRQFIKEREWQKYHTPRNLTLALMGQVGEVAEIFQWKGQVQNGLPSFSEEEKVHVGEELADVLSYLIRLGDVCGIDLSKAMLDKVQKNRKKYPAEQTKGSLQRYDEIKKAKRTVHLKDKE